MNNEDKFYTYLAEYQDDIKRLISVKRRDNHLMSVDEIASDLNVALLKRKDKIIDFKNETFNEFCFESFKFQVCSYIKKMLLSGINAEKSKKSFIAEEMIIR